MGDATGPPPWQRYEETEDDIVPEAFCLMVVQGAETDQILAAFAAERAPVVTGTFGQAWELVAQSEPDVDVTYIGQWAVTGLIQVIGAGESMIVVDEGATGTWKGIAERASAAGVCAAFSTDINAHMSVMLARDGRVVRDFDPLLDVSMVGDPLPEEADLPFGDADDPCAMSLLLIERWTGCAFPSYAELFKATRPVYRYIAVERS